MGSHIRLYPDNLKVYLIKKLRRLVERYKKQRDNYFKKYKELEIKKDKQTPKKVINQTKISNKDDDSENCFILHIGSLGF